MCLAVPGRIVRTEGDGLFRNGMVQFDGVATSVALACVPEAEVGDYVLVHAGLAIARIDERVARETLELLSLAEQPAKREEPEP